MAITATASLAAAQDSTFDIWYGDPQAFGQIGNPQTWVNVLGNVSDPDGMFGLTASLNGGPPWNISLGPNTRRLLDPGDFNVEIDHTTLLGGPNTIVLNAEDLLGNFTQHNVTVNYDAGRIWPQDYAVAWSTVTDLQDVCQIVDGQWFLEPDGIRPTVLGYDRTFAVGDLNWSDYEVTVPLTIHGIDPAGFMFPSVAPGVGFTVRWSGHTELTFGEQPHQYWRPAGATAWYGYEDDRARLIGWDGLQQGDPLFRTLDFDVTYFWKVRVESQGGGDTTYSFKFWEDGTAEPGSWFMSITEGPPDPQQGSVLFVAHHVDVTYGDIDIVSLATDSTPPQISNVEVTALETTAIVNWETDEPATSNVDYGTSSGNLLDTEGDSTLVSQHSVLLTGLTPSTTYFYEVSSTDGFSNAETTSEMSFTTDSGSPPASAIVSDDFASGPLNGGLWSVVDPQGDLVVTTPGLHLQLEVPAGSSHAATVGSNTLARVRQPIADSDFEVEARFDSRLDGPAEESQGLTFEAAGGGLLLVEFRHSSGTTSLRAESISGGASTLHLSSAVPVGLPSRLRVRRLGDDWIVSYHNGSAWVPTGSFEHVMTASWAGVHIGNDGTEPHSSLVDYFFNTFTPIANEDGGLYAVLTDVNGQGAIQISPSLAGYPSGQMIDLTAVPDSGWQFDSWGGDLAGTDNPLQFTVSGDTVATGNFSEEADQVPPQITNVQAIPFDVSATITWSTDEPATSAVAYGPSAAYELGTISSPTLVMQHMVGLPGLAPSTLYHYQVTSVDAAGNPSSSGDATFMTQAAGPDLSGLVSDDFSTAVLDTSIWEFLDPLSDSALRMTSTQVEMDANPATDHDAWTSGIKCPRIRQDCLDEDFEVDVKFDSALTVNIQQQGILAEQDNSNFLRFELLRHQGQTKAFIASIIGGSATVHYFAPVAIGVPSYLRVTRSGDLWSVLHSSDGVNFATVVTFSQPIAISGVSVFTGNSSGTAHTAIADYFFNTASPISPEDANPSALVVNTVGQGEVQRTPDELHYMINDMVDLLAVPDSGWTFTGWSGDATGMQNPLSLTLTSPMSVTATFSQVGNDCNGNGIDDLLDISNGTSEDCNGNSIPDECEADCDGDGIPDDCEADCDGDGLPDDCEVDCNSNGTPDDCEAFDDCNGNGVPDECDPDCDVDGLPDDCEEDCNSNGMPDDCEVITDCNSNGVPDECDLASGASQDLDGSGVPDECESIGMRYCPAVPNSTGAPGFMIVLGSTLVADDDLTLSAIHLPTNNNIGYFIMGQGMNVVTPPGAAGPICVAPGIKRYLPPVNNTNQFPGGFSRVVGTMGPVSGNIDPGETWNFQAWHRDSIAGTSNLTDAVSVTFQ